MSPDRDSGRRESEEPETDGYEVDARRSIFSALWFRALLVVLVLGVIAAVGVPYLLDVTTQPVKTPAVKWTAAAPTPAAPPAVVPPPAPVPAPAVAAPAVAAPAVAAPKSPATVTPRSAEPVPAQPQPTPTAVTKVAEAPRQAAKETPKETPKRTAATAGSKSTAAKPLSPASAGGSYWVQVGAFKDPDTAKRLAVRLGEQGFRAEQSTTTKGGGAPPRAPAPAAAASNRYNVLVSGASAADVDAKLAGKGKTSESTAGGVVVQPSLPLREAIALARDLADAGFSVQVRRTAGPAPRADVAGSGETLHRVRVGGFADRAAAGAALKGLQAKGFTPFIARENP
jgi:cell division septation protein DedD